ncbi:phosphoglycerate kinase [Candidatus Woesearchaeota archaeon]|nr:phosphoglycerate kinase [Candidatus Woesearchaeota archaeon]
MPFLTLNDMNFRNKRVFLRADFNVPLDDKGNITNDKRIRETLPTIQTLLKQKCKLIIATHVGRPEGKRVPTLSTKSIAIRLQELLGKEVKHVGGCVEDEIENYVAQRTYGEIVMLENLRFYPEEEKNDVVFAQQLARLADLYVNDAFSVCHRANASVAAITTFLPCCAGLLMEKELKHLVQVQHPEKPFIAIIGGAKADKIGVIKTLLPKVDKILFGGVLANTMLKARGYKIGRSKYDEETLKVAKEILMLGKSKVILPQDFIMTNKPDKTGTVSIEAVGALSDELMAVDIGPETIAEYKKYLKQAKTIMWAGPIGMFEVEQFFHGTKEITECVANQNAIKIVGGGDSAASVEKCNLQDKMTYVSTAGGAFLDFVEGKKLPAIAMLEQYYEKHIGQYKKED